LNKAISAGIGVAIGLIALAVIFLAPQDGEVMDDDSQMGVQLSDQVDVQSENSKSFEVGISEGVQLGDGSP